MSKLVIVESPAKAKTIQKYLGKGYEVIASMGHVRDLPKSKLGVDVENGFTPQYTNMKDKGDVIRKLKTEAKKSDFVYLATDPDREGEAISWHLAQLLKLDMNGNNRVEFNEITKNGVKNGMSHPHKIDLDLVNAQQARRILDRLVGYKLSPFLWKKVRQGLSAGRVQSVAVRLIVDRENEIRAFVPQEYWSIDAKCSAPPSSAIFAAKLIKVDGKRVDKMEIPNKEAADVLLERLKNANYTVQNTKKRVSKWHPAPPFITSTLQQDASYRLGFQSKRTMKVAQELYEGIEIDGMGAVGLITYMRTDSLRISDELCSQNEADGPVFKMKNDPRVMKIGRFLRRASLDEIPQFFNVLNGTMSFVGPRPPLPQEMESYTPYQLHRLDVKGGITCYWQCSGRSNIMFDTWVELDLKYIRECSAWVDFKILLRTVVAILKRDGAE